MDQAIDDIKVDTLRTNCTEAGAFYAKNITDTSATLGWTAGCTDSAYSIEYGLSGFAPGTGNIVNSTADTVDINGLSSLTNYDFYVIYDPLIEEIKRVVKKELNFISNKINILDSGCGEGYYSEKALNNLEGLKSIIIGTDISKYAVKNAAKKYKKIFYFVSSIYSLPVKSDSLDLILSVFSPNHSPEFSRVLAKDGYLIVVSPGENHMKQLAELIYNSFRPHEYNIVEKIGVMFSHLKTQRKTFEIEITDSFMLQNLLKMTPYYWNTSKEAQEKIENCNHIKITCDFNITVFEKV